MKKMKVTTIGTLGLYEDGKLEKVTDGVVVELTTKTARNKIFEIIKDNASEIELDEMREACSLALKEKEEERKIANLFDE